MNNKGPPAKSCGAQEENERRKTQQGPKTKIRGMTNPGLGEMYVGGGEKPVLKFDANVQDERERRGRRRRHGGKISPN